MAHFDSDAAHAMLAAHVAPWVLDLGLVYEDVSADRAVARLPLTDAIVRVGGMVCGQALLAAADTTTVIALCGAIGRMIFPSTVNLSLNFARPLVASDGRIEARILRAGKSMAFAEISIYAAASGALCAHGTSALALPAE